MESKFLQDVYLEFALFLELAGSNVAQTLLNPSNLLIPRNDRKVRDIQLTNQIKFRSRSLRSIEHARVHDFRSKQFSCRQPFN